MTKENSNENFMNRNCSRRTALKIMIAGCAGAAVTGSLLESCKGGSDKPGTKTSGAKSAGKGLVTSRSWESTGDTVSLLGLGCMRFPQKNNGQGRGGEIDQQQVNDMVDYALEHGVNYFDTAPVYMGSEEATGIALSRHPRESYFIATKMSNFQGGSVETARNMFETSLARLRTTYVDYFLLHSAGSQRDLENRFINNGVMDYILEEKKAGRIRHIGFSFHGNREGMDYMLSMHPKYNWEFIQIQMNYFDWADGNGRGADAEYLYNRISEMGIPVVVMEPVRGGALANVNDKFRDMMAEARPDLSPAGMALSFVGTYPGVMTVLSGMSNMEQMQENVATFTDFKPLKEKDVKLLLDIAKLQHENATIGCTGCRYCMPCAYGVDIPGNFLMYDKCANEYSLPNPEGEHDKEYSKKRKAFINRYKALEEKSRADSCINCRSCVSKCPQHINIPNQLDKIKSLVDMLEKG